MLDRKISNWTLSQNNKKYNYLVWCTYFHMTQFWILFGCHCISNISAYVNLRHIQQNLWPIFELRLLLLVFRNTIIFWPQCYLCEWILLETVIPAIDEFTLKIIFLKYANILALERDKIIKKPLSKWAFSMKNQNCS